MTIHHMSTFDTLQELLSQQLEISTDVIQLETVLDTIDLDSLARIDFALALEKRFTCQFEERNILKWKTVQDIVDAIDQVSQTV